MAYTVVDAAGEARTAQHSRHNFAGVGQRYERLAGLVPSGAYRKTPMGRAFFEIFEAAALWDTALEVITKDPAALVHVCGEDEDEGHYLKRGGSEAAPYYSYTVGKRSDGTNKYKL